MKSVQWKQGSGCAFLKPAAAGRGKRWKTPHLLPCAAEGGNLPGMVWDRIADFRFAPLYNPKRSSPRLGILSRLCASNSCKDC